MSCYHPLKAFRTPEGVVFSELGRYDIIGDIELPCGQCIGCRMRRAAEWTQRVMHESQMWAENCAVTLTYADEHLPAGGTLAHRDFQLFMKRVRKEFGPVRFFMCGEYGPLNLRPHYHACLFGCMFEFDRVAGKSAAGAVFYESDLLTKLWGRGICSVQPLVRETAGYCARYIMKKVLGDAAEAHYGDRKPEYCAMSLKPGIGALWFSIYGDDVYPHDFCVAGGVKYKPPRYYDKLLKRSGGDMDDLVFERELRARAACADNTDDRRRVREVVHEAKVRNLNRGDLV